MYFLPSHLRSYFFYNKILLETEYEIVWKLHLYYDLYYVLTRMWCSYIHKINIASASQFEQKLRESNSLARIIIVGLNKYLIH